MTQKNAEGIAFYDFVLLAMRQWWVGALCVGIAVGVALWVGFTTEAVYRAESILMLAESSDQSASGLPDQLGGLAALAGLSLRGAGDRKAEAIATLQSRRLSDSFVRERNLLPILFEERWDRESNAWKPNAEVPTLWDAYEKMSEQIIKVVEDRKTGLIELGVQWTDPELAAEWSDEVVQRTNKLMQEAAYDRATRNIAYLKRQLEETSIVGVREALNNLMESELKTSMLAQRSEDYVFKIVDPAVVPEERVWPRRGLLLILGGAAGIFFWVFVLVVAQVMSSLVEQHHKTTSHVR